MNINYRVDKSGLFGSCTPDQLIDTAPLLLGQFVSGTVSAGKDQCVQERKVEEINLYFMNEIHREIARDIIYNRCYNNKLK
jgi:hypothetical protein